jgi:hypothetical protein
MKHGGAINEMLKRAAARHGPFVARRVVHRVPALQASTYCSQEFGTRSRRFIFSTL